MLRTAFGAFLLSLVGLIFILWATPLGVGIFSDSADYIIAARNFAHGNGLLTMSGDGKLKALSHFPPLYPVLLSIIELSNVSYWSGLRVLMALLFGVNLFLTSYLVSTFTNRETLGICAGLLFLVAPAMGLIHCMAWSEPLFLTFEILSLLFISLAFQDLPRGGLTFIFVAGLLAGLSFLTRFAGVALIVTGSLCCLLNSELSIKTRILWFLLYLTGVAFIVSPWVLYSLHLDATLFNRTLAYHPIDTSRVLPALETIIKILLPIQSETYVLWFSLIALFLCMGLWHARELRLKPQLYRPAPYGLSLILGTFVIAYLAVIGVASSLADSAIPFNTRIFSPLYPPFVALFLAFFSSIAVHGGFMLRGTIRLVVVMVLILSIPPSLIAANKMRSEGVGFASRSIRQAEEFKLLQRLESTDSTVYSNAPEIFWLYTTTKALALPGLSDPTDATAKEAYRNELMAIKTGLRKAQKKSYVVFFRSIQWRSYLQAEPELVELLNLEPFQVGSTITIYSPRKEDRK